MTDGAALLTTDDVTRLIARRKEALELVAELDKKLEALRLILGPERFAEITGTAPTAKTSFREVLEKAIKSAPHGATYDELREALREAGFGDSVDRSPNTFYNAISHFVRAGTAVKVGNRVASREAYDAMPPGVREALEREGAQLLGAPALVLSVLREAGKPLMPGEVVERAEKADPRVKANAIYAALSRMSLGGRGIKRGSDGRYRLAGDSEPETTAALLWTSAP